MSREENMIYDFNHIINRRSVSTINKWTFYPEEVLPLWVADMDFLSPKPVLDALRSSVDHGVMGYEEPGHALLETVVVRLEKLYGWKITPEMVVAIPGVGAGMSAAVNAFSSPGEGLLVQPPIFPPFLQLPKAKKRITQNARLKRSLRNGHWYYEPDLNSFDKSVHSNRAQTRLFLLCNPHNPTGRTFTADELTAMAQICLRRNILILSDEIHNGLLLNKQEHVPIASLSREIAENTITFLGPGKTFNMSGLHCAFAVIPNEKLRKQFIGEVMSSVLEVNSLGMAAAQAAYSGACDEWLAELRRYLGANRDYAVKFINSELPALRTTHPEGTYLLWIDCNEMIRTGRILGRPYQHFLKKGQLALSNGDEFGPGGKGFVRMNFACPRPVLDEGLQRLKKALHK
jgi:cystathionine beta-lyase